MNQEVDTFSGMQADHRQWDYEQLNWRVDIERWRREHELALSQLATLQEVVRQHVDALQSYSEQIDRHQQSVRDYDRAVSDDQIQGVGERFQETFAAEHREHAKRQKAQHEAHERIEKHHRTVMAHLTKLKSAIEAAM